MKKFLVLVLTLALAFASVSHVTASATSKDVRFDYEDLGITVIIENADGLDAEKQQFIADCLAYDTTPKETRAWCWLLGHDYVTTTASTVIHEARETAPRCLRKTYNFTTCENCDYYEKELIGQKYIACCAE